MKIILLTLTLGLLATSNSHAVEILHWQRVPISVPLIVGQERIVFLDRNKVIRVGVPATAAERLSVQSAGGSVYLKASAPLEPTRVQLQDERNGQLILLDVTAKPASDKEPPAEPIEIIDGWTEELHEERQLVLPAPTPVPVELTRFAAQSLYAPLRTVEAVSGITPAPLRGNHALATLLPTAPVNTQALAAWRLEDYWVTAVKLTHTQADWLTLDPRDLQGDFVAATFQHPDLGPAGESTDTTVVYLVTRGSGLAGDRVP